jgi:gamma-glutamyltranspeptidase/glutathione hydrolase
MADGARSPDRYDALRPERWTTRKQAGVSRRGVVTSQHYAAAEAGAQMLAEGGNAVDAAVTAAFTLQTVEPWMSSLMACGYMLVAQPDGRVQVVEFNGRIPGRYDPETYRADPELKTFIGHPASVDFANVRGFTAACVPGCVKGFAEALERYGTIPFARALAPAIARAAQGLRTDWHTTLAIALAEADLRAEPGAAAIFLPDGAPPEPGRVLPLAALHATLTELAAGGADALYRGDIGRRLTRDIQAGGGCVTMEDLAAYEALHYPARSMAFGAKTVHVAGESSAGTRVFDALAHFAAERGPGPVDAGFFVAMARACWHAFDEHRVRLRPTEADPKSSTTQVNAVDAEGRMVAITFTLLNRFGARALSASTGILCNNGMSWFDPRPDRANSLRPNARAPSNMCPVAITDENGSFAVLGAAGGNQIVPCMAQLTAMLVMAGMDPEEAMNRPRMSTGASRDIAVNLDMAEDEIAALAALGTIRPMQQQVYPRPFAAPGIAGRRGDGFVGMADTTYPAAFAATPEGRA